MGKVIEFPAQNTKATSAVPEASLNYAPSVEYANDQPPREVVEELNMAFGPDNFTFEWLVVTPSGYRVPENATTLPFPQDGYNVVG